MVGKDEKRRRMQIRKNVGNRPLSDEALKATGKIPKQRFPDYLVAHACFNCRKSFKYAVEDKYSVSYSKLCPQCGTDLFLMGRSFEAPKKSDKKQWLKVEKLRRAGFMFHTNTYEMAGYPKKLGEVDLFLRNNPNHRFRIK